MPDEPVKVTDKPVEKPAASPVESTTKTPAAAEGAKKKNSTLKIVLIVLGVFVGLGILGTVASIIFLGAVFDKANDSINNGEVTIQSQDGDTKVQAGENVSLAAGFPTDVPIFDPSTLKASSSTADTEFTAIASTASSVTDVTNFYKTQMAAEGWTVSYDASSDTGTILTFDKDNRTAGVIVSTSENTDSNETTGLVVTVTTKQ